MAVRLQGTKRSYIGRSTDQKPRPGCTDSDGITPTAQDILAGSTYECTDSPDVFEWNGFDWVLIPKDERVIHLLGELLQETRAVRAGLELDLSHKLGFHVDLRTEEVNQLQEN